MAGTKESPAEYSRSCSSCRFNRSPPRSAACRSRRPTPRSSTADSCKRPTPKTGRLARGVRLVCRRDILRTNVEGNAQDGRQSSLLRRRPGGRNVSRPARSEAGQTDGQVQCPFVLRTDVRVVLFESEIAVAGSAALPAVDQRSAIEPRQAGAMAAQGEPRNASSIALRERHRKQKARDYGHLVGVGASHAAQRSDDRAGGVVGLPGRQTAIVGGDGSSSARRIANGRKTIDHSTPVMPTAAAGIACRCGARESARLPACDR